MSLNHSFLHRLTAGAILFNSTNSSFPAIGVRIPDRSEGKKGESVALLDLIMGCVLKSLSGFYERVARCSIFDSSLLLIGTPDYQWPRCEFWFAFEKLAILLVYQAARCESCDVSLFFVSKEFDRVSWEVLWTLIFMRLNLKSRNALLAIVVRSLISTVSGIFIK
jgi:hypothetical protein